MARVNPILNLQFRFLICTGPSPSLNNQVVAFGKVIEGMDLIDQICSLPVNKQGRPMPPVVIDDCGELAAPGGLEGSENNTSSSVERSIWNLLAWFKG